MKSRTKFVRTGLVAAKRKAVQLIYDRIKALPDYDQQIIQLCDYAKRHYPIVIKSKQFKYLYEYICKQTPLLNDKFYKLSTRIYWVLNKIYSWDDPRVRCRICNKPFKNKNVATLNNGYGAGYCEDIACMNKSEEHIQHCKESMLKNWGAPTVLQVPKFYQALIDGSLREFNTENPAWSPECTKRKSETYFKRTGYKHNMQNPECLAQRVQTYIRNYGVDSPVKNKDVLAKIQQTTYNTYGDTCIFRTDYVQRFVHKTFSYDGFGFASEPELVYYIWLKDNNVQFVFQPPERVFTYEYDGITHTYRPDFLLLDENICIDIKGEHFFKDHDPTQEMINPFDRSQDALYQAKYECMKKNNVQIILSRSETIKKCQNYIEKTYGKGYLDQFKRC